MPPDPIAALAGAEAGSRELDALVAEAMGWKKDAAGEWHQVGAFFGDGKVRMTVYAVDLPPWTTSVDAALTLVPEGCACHMSRAPNDTASRASVWKRRVYFDDQQRRCTAFDMIGDGGIEPDGTVIMRTLALAICLAALRAKDNGHG